MHGRDAAAEDHPTTREWSSALIDATADGGTRLDWVNCGLCVDERGVGESITGTRRGSPADLAKFVAASAGTLVIPTK